MSQSGEVVLFTTRELADPLDAAERTLILLKAERLTSAIRSEGESREWDAFVSDVEDPGAEFESLGRGLPLESLRGLYVPGTCLHVAIGTPLWREYDRAVREAIPEAVRGGFVPSSPGIVIGWHDVWECSEKSEGQFFGRAFFAFRLFGHTSPNDWPQCRRMLLELPFVRDLKESLEEFVGPLEAWVRCDTY